jgi:hypothetical protein
MELKEAIETLEGLIEPQSTLLGSFDKEAIKTALEELDKLNKRIEYALDFAYDYDGYYNPETKKGNAEGLAMTIDDMVTVLKGKMKGVE